ncbi:MAG: calcium-binding protein [Litorimonas sp.]
MTTYFNIHSYAELSDPAKENVFRQINEFHDHLQTEKNNDDTFISEDMLAFIEDAKEKIEEYRAENNIGQNEIDINEDSVEAGLWLQAELIDNGFGIDAWLSNQDFEPFKNAQEEIRNSDLNKGDFGEYFYHPTQSDGSISLGVRPRDLSSDEARIFSQSLREYAVKFSNYNNLEKELVSHGLEEYADNSMIDLETPNGSFTLPQDIMENINNINTAPLPLETPTLETVPSQRMGKSIKLPNIDFIEFSDTDFKSNSFEFNRDFPAIQFDLEMTDAINVHIRDDLHDYVQDTLINTSHYTQNEHGVSNSDRFDPETGLGENNRDLQLFVDIATGDEIESNPTGTHNYGIYAHARDIVEKAKYGEIELAHPGSDNFNGGHLGAVMNYEYYTKSGVRGGLAVINRRIPIPFVKAKDGGLVMIGRDGGSHFGTRNDDLSIGSNFATMGKGNDIVLLDKNAENGKAYGGEGKDYILGSDNADHLHGGRGRDILIGGKGDDRLYGAGKNDDEGRFVVNDKGERDILKGGEGKDYYFAGDNDIIIASRDAEGNSLDTDDKITLAGGFELSGPTTIDAKGNVRGEHGEIYEFSNSGELTVRFMPGSHETPASDHTRDNKNMVDITIKDFQNGDFGFDFNNVIPLSSIEKVGERANETLQNIPSLSQDSLEGVGRSILNGAEEIINNQFGVDLSNTTGQILEPIKATPTSIPFNEVVKQFVDDRAILRTIDPDANLTVTQAANHPESEAMIVRLNKAGLEHFPAELLQGETPQERVETILIEAHEMDKGQEFKRMFENSEAINHQTSLHNAEEEIDYTL